MKPIPYKVQKSHHFLQNIQAGPVIAKIKGSVKKLGDRYSNADVVLYNRANLQPIAIHKPDENGDYRFLGLNTDLTTFVVAFDEKRKYNAVIQDNVVPK